MRDPNSPFAAPEQKTGKGKKLLLPLAFSVLALVVLLLVLAPVVGGFRPAAASSGLKDEAEVPLLATPAPAQDAAEAADAATPQPQFAEFTAYPEAGDYLGHLTISGTAVDCDVYYGDSEAEFEKGAGTYKGGCIPGEGGTILMGAHTNTYFRDFESVQPGAEVTFVTEYGEYHYTVTGTRVATDTDTTAYDLDAAEENLTMYTCYPFGVTTYTDERFFVYCDYVSGPSIAPYLP